MHQPLPAHLSFELNSSPFMTQQEHILFCSSSSTQLNVTGLLGN